MSRKDYIAIAAIVGDTLAAAAKIGHRETVYQTLYLPLVGYFESDSPGFDRLRFGHAVATRELDLKPGQS